MSKESASPTVALVTGANQGIGYEIAKRLASEHPDYHVFMTGRRKEAIEKAASELQEAGLNVEPLVLDITSDDSIKSALDIIRSKFGHLDVLINNAGILSGKPEDSIRQKLTTVYDTNVFGTIAVTDAFIPLLCESTKVRRVVFTQYIVFLSFPHTLPPPRAPKDEAPRSHQDFYRCNCTTCHKAGFLHMRLASAPDDFLLLKPLDPYNDLGDYTVYEKDLHFLFCKTCGMRCFIVMGEGEVANVDLTTVKAGADADAGAGSGVEKGEEEAARGKDGAAAGEKSVTKVWRPRKQGWVEGKKFGSYLSVNGYSVDAGQDGFDLREITEKKWIGYCDWLELHSEGSQGTRHDRPWEGGAY
ncbi:hypothetical protein CORC01_02267 [Colletotrichum orchidophilum]|uniref:Short chain dehydrogenase n=1 Tax=Colletotrichum orchidophilum TaxID=1209926 RepID=A0A1G4BM84_9PEZI|nr:uncharacterized protein CORC01_02267 [Colletotrichum orchidophilum]OHF02572.1 hypothetical protein CORC01_02267 [Colletotrichum orchidophilum]